MKIKLLIIFSFIFFGLNIALAQDEDVQYAKLQNINYTTFEAQPFKKVLENDIIKGYVSATLFADDFHKEFPYICLQYTKVKYPHESVVLKIYLDMNTKEIKQAFKKRNHLNMKKYANFKVNRIVLFYPETMKMLSAFSLETPSRTADTTLWNNMDTSFIRKSIGQSLSILFKNKLLRSYKAYRFGSKYLTLYYGEYLYFTVHLNKKETLRPYIYKDALNLWNISHLLDEKIESIEVDISGQRHQVLRFK